MSMNPSSVNDGGTVTLSASGREEVVAGVQTYVVGNGKTLVIIATDAFGIANAKQTAERFALNGFTAIIPDLFNGDALPTDALENAAKAGNNPMAEIFFPWLSRHPLQTSSDVLLKVIDAKSADYSSVHLSGYFYGCACIIPLYTHNAVKSVAMSNPTRLTKENASQIIKSTMFVFAEGDNVFTPELLSYYEQTFKERSDVIFSRHSAQQHTYAVHDDGTKESSEHRQKAVEEVVQFFQQHK